jgi:hypothetical protein
MNLKIVEIINEILAEKRAVMNREDLTDIYKKVLVEELDKELEEICSSADV